MKYVLPDLEYSFDALEPYISAETVEVHYLKHHKGYVDKLNRTDYCKVGYDDTLEDIICKDKGNTFNLAAQVWNHNFYWQCLSPDNSNKLDASLASSIKTQLGSLNKLKSELSNAANTEFGSGWAWLTVDSGNKLKILSTTDAENPLQNRLKPIFTIDVWEHAYYLDYKNEREKYVNHVLEHLINWTFVSKQFQSAIRA